jgi:hypothetical protein
MEVKNYPKNLAEVRLMKEIKLSKGFALVDDEDFCFLNKWKWCNVRGYAERKTIKNGKNFHVRMHRLILGLKNTKNVEVDHIDRNRSNNQKSNLRICTVSQNHANAIIQKRNKSGFKGVIWRKRAKKWEAQIGVNKKKVYLGIFSDINKAAIAYNDAALKFYGNFSRLNEVAYV